MLRASLAGRERLPVPHHSSVRVYETENGDDDDDETYGLNGGRGEKRLHRKNVSWPLDEFRYRRSLITRIVTKPCRSIKAFLLLVVSLFIAFWFLTASIRPGTTTFVFHETDTHRVWEWSIQSGHWMSWRPIKKWFHPPRNPSLPSPTSGEDTEHAGGVIGCGWQRRYIHVDDLVYNNNTSTSQITTTKPSPYLRALFPPRPVPGSIVDFDIVSQYCDLTTGQYLRTCLSFLRLGAALFSPPSTTPPSLHTPAPKDTLPDTPSEVPYFYVGNARKVAQIPKKPRTLPNDWRYCYLEDRMSTRAPMSEWTRYGGGRGVEMPLDLERPKVLKGGVPPWTIKEGTMMIGEAEKHLENEDKPEKFEWKAGQCDEDYPRIVHMSMEQGQFGDAPYMTLLSFLYSQNLGLGLDSTNATAYSGPCRPEFWVWIGGATVDEETATWEKRIASNSWSEVFTDKAYKDIIKFKRWNATEQMDATSEIAGEWRNAAALDIRPKRVKDTDVVNLTTKVTKHGDTVEDNDLKKRSSSGSTASGPDAGDRLHDSMGISQRDTARWLLPHRYGGVYVEPGVLFLRDWEELWNFRGPFSTRAFGTGSTGASVLRLNKRSALGTLVLRTALRHGMVLDARAVQTYVEDAGVDQMLFPMPEMLEDLTYWSAEAYQKLHPVMPILESPQEFFETREASLPASTIGVSGFFRGAWFYHAKPEWEVPFDIVRNFAGSRKRSPAGVFGPADKWEVPWSSVFKRTFEGFMRGEQPNLYGEWLLRPSP